MTTSSNSPITIVSGLPRSGTSLMMRMLDAAGIPPLTDGQRAADDDNPLGYYELEAVKATRSDPGWLARARGHAVKVIHVLLLDLPAGTACRVIFMRRAMGEVLASQRTMLQRQGRPGSVASDDVLRRQYEAQLRQVDAFLAGRPEIQRLDVDYNGLVARPAAEVPRIAQFIERPGAIDAMVRAIDPSLYRNRRG